MNHAYSEKALRQMDWDIRNAKIEAYLGDYIHDRIYIAQNEPQVFIWVIRDSGTHIYNLDQHSLRYDDTKEFYDYIRNVIACLRYHQQHENVVATFAYFCGYAARIRMEDAILLSISYLPAGAAHKNLGSERSS